MTQTATLEAPAPVSPAQPRRLRRWLIRLLLVALLAAAFAVYSRIADDYLNQTVADLDRTDPGWRLEELEAARPAVADEKNSALCAQAAYRRLPGNWASLTQKHFGQEPARFTEAVMNLPPSQQLTREQFAPITGLLDEARTCLSEAYRLADLPEGRFPLPPDRGYLTDSGGHAHQVRAIVNLFRLDALRLAHEGKIDQALTVCRAALNAGRALGDEPSSHVQLVRRVCLYIALATAERVLAQGEPSAACLAGWHRALQVEFQRPAVLIALRADRATWHHTLTAFESFDSRALDEQEKNFFVGSQEVPPGAWVLRAAAVPHVKQMHADMLGYLTAAVEAARRPVEKQQAAFTTWESTAELPTPVDRGMPSRIKTDVAGYRRSDALLRCAVVAAAVEGFRLKHGKWPADLKEAGTLADPFGGWLRYRRVADGVVVYSVGPDGIDNQGDLQRGNRGGADIGVQLWDVPHRRALAPPPFVGPPPPPGLKPRRP